jgi:DNA-damage-inducible protein J
MDSELKKQVEWILDGLGMNMTTGFIVFAKAVARCGGIPFDVRDNFYSAGNIAAIQHSVRQMERGEYVVKTMAELEKMAED